jgi:two-component system nitrate/nitrite response regulator NarL
MNAIRILIVDENPIFRRILNRFLHDEYPNHVAVVGTVTRFEIAPVKAQRLQPEVILVDNGLPGLMRLFCVARLRALCPEADIIVLTLQDKPDYRKSGFEAGADDFIQKDNVFSDLMPAIERIVKVRSHHAEEHQSSREGDRGHR